MPKTLLLADDSVTIQKVVGISFANEDIEITTVDNGRDAVAKAKALRPDVILADVVMPGMSGYEVCEAVKADPNLRHIPVLLLTGTFEAFDQARATAVGAAGHVAKPFEAQTLVDRVKQLLAAAPAPARPAAAAAPAPAMRPAPPSDDAFDFFSDAPATRAAASPPPVPSAEAFDLDGPDGAFAFGDDDLSADVPAPAAARRPADATIAILPDAPAGASDDAFEFSFEGGGRNDALDEPLDPDQLGHTTLLDPAAGSGFDVSSSDLSFTREPAAATQVFAIDDGPQSLPLAAEDAELDLAETDPLDLPEAVADAAPAAADPFATTIAPLSRAPRDEAFDPFESESFEDAPMMMGEPLAAGDDFDDSPFAATPALASEVDAEPWDDAPSFAAPKPSTDLDGTPGAAPAIASAELRDMIEKIAWDAFAPVTEKIVREAIAKIEQVAWEVVPKLAETLIQEEIRRLKGGS
jgi:CheY-like chemotaxis protein